MAPIFHKAKCTAGHKLKGATFTIPSVKGVTYYQGSQILKSGTYRVAPGVEDVVTAVADTVYFFNVWGIS